MAGLAEIGGVLLSRSQAEMEVAAQNMANMATPGYRARRAFSLSMSVGTESPRQRDNLAVAVDFAPGKTVMTNNPLDLALGGEGFFAVRSGEKILVTRNGQFRRDADGHLVSADGLPVQSTQGDVGTVSENPVITRDGVILDHGEPVGRLAVVRIADPASLVPAGNGLFEAPQSKFEQVAVAVVQQGAVESSNVSSATEMLTVMSTLRRAESGQRIIQLYDDLMGKALTGFGQL